VKALAANGLAVLFSGACGKGSRSIFSVVNHANDRMGYNALPVADD
jgi:hypothetical protein